MFLICCMVLFQPVSSDQGVRGHGSQGHSLALHDLLIEDDKRGTKPHYSQTKVVHNTVCHNIGNVLDLISFKLYFFCEHKQEMV